MKKGIVLGHRVAPVGFERDVLSIDKIEYDSILKYLLYWDEIDIPKHSGLNMSSGILDSLVNLDVAKSTKIELPRSVNICFEQIDNDSVAAQLKAWEINNEKEPGVWSIAQPDMWPQIDDGEVRQVIDFELYNCLPVPSEETPIEKILDFKSRREDELLEFRLSLDDVYQKIISSGDVPRAKNAEIQRLKLRINDVEKALIESKVKCYLGNLRSVNHSSFGESLGLALSSGLAADSCLSLGALESVGVGVGVAMLSVALRSQKMPIAKDGRSPDFYLKSAHKELNVFGK